MVGYSIVHNLNSTFPNYWVSMKDEVERYLEMADEYYRLGMELFGRRDYFDAAEKVWASVRAATLALTQRFLGRTTPPEGVYWREFVTDAFIRAGLSKDEAEERASYFIEVRRGLHGECFYGLIYEEIEHKPLIEKAREYISEIRRLLKGSV